MKNKNIGLFFKDLCSHMDNPKIVPILGIIIVAVFASFSANKIFRIKTDYQVGDTARHTVKSNQYIVFEDPKKTEEKKREAADHILTIYDYDSGQIDKISNRIDKAFAMARELALNEKQSGGIKPVFENTLGFKINQGAFKLLKDHNFSEKHGAILKKIVSEVLKNGVVGNKTLLMKEIDKGILLRDIYSGEETFVKRLRKFYGPDQAKAMVRIIGDPILKDSSYNIINLMVDLSQRLIRPNITINKNETQERKYLAVENVSPALYRMTKGEVIIRKGDIVTPLHMVKLNALKKEVKTKSNWLNILGKSFSILFFISVIYISFLRKLLEPEAKTNKNLVFLTLVVLFNILLAKLLSFIPPLEIAGGEYMIPDTAIKLSLPVASAAMLVCLFFGTYQAYTMALICGFVCSMIFEHHIPGLFIFFLINGVMGTYWLKECRERQVFVKTGVKLAIFNVLISPAFLIQIPDISMVEIILSLLFAALGGILSGIFTGGIAPLLEIIFGYTSDIKLMELSNPEQKLLRRLMLEAPGTYNHSMIVGTMAEAAAAEVGANAILARVGGYYHDIGKLKKPMYFIENQRHGKNLHNKLSPSMSVLILTAHVKDGISLAKKYKLPENIIDIINQHHGTSLIKFFYEKAKQKKTDQEPLKNDYKYPGPRPQTREAAIVMLADITEAAARSLDNPSASRIQGVVQKQINSCFSDSQLDGCNLTLKDLHQIAKSFNKILTGIHHHRIKYEEEKEDVKNDGNSNTKQERNNQDNQQQPKSQDESYLKRLGL